MLRADDTVLAVVDVQGKLAQMMYNKQSLFANLQKIIKGARTLGIPVLWAEQNPEGLGRTVPEIADLLSGCQPISKLSFSCCGSDPFVRALRDLGRKQVVIAGIEAHVCVFQTGVDLLDMGFEVHVVADAVSSRTVENRQVGLERVREAGASVTSTEMALFEILKVAGGDKFREILRIVK